MVLATKNDAKKICVLKKPTKKIESADVKKRRHKKPMLRAPVRLDPTLPSIYLINVKNLA